MLTHTDIYNKLLYCRKNDITDYIAIYRIYSYYFRFRLCFTLSKFLLASGIHRKGRYIRLALRPVVNYECRERVDGRQSSIRKKRLRLRRKSIPARQLIRAFRAFATIPTCFLYIFANRCGRTRDAHGNHNRKRGWPLWFLQDYLPISIVE